MGLQTKSVTAPIALIKMIDPNNPANLITIGKMKNVRITETFRRVGVKGIGQLFDVERPVVDWTGNLTCSSMVVNLVAAGFAGQPNRNTNSAEEFANTLLMNETGLQVYLYRKVKTTTNANGIVTVVDEEPIWKVVDAFIERESFDLVEGQVMGKDQDFSYLTPILVPSEAANPVNN